MAGSSTLTWERLPRRKGGRHSVGPAAHPDLPSVAGAWWSLSHRLLGRSRVGCSGPEPALSSSRAHLALPQREGCDRSGGRKFLLPVLTPSVLKCPCLWQVVFRSFTSAAGIVSFQSLCCSPLPSCPPRCSAARLPSCPAQCPSLPQPLLLLPCRWCTRFLLTDLTSAIKVNTLVRWLCVNGGCASK